MCSHWFLPNSVVEWIMPEDRVVGSVAPGAGNRGLSRGQTLPRAGSAGRSWGRALGVASPGRPVVPESHPHRWPVLSPTRIVVAFCCACGIHWEAEGSSRRLSWWGPWGWYLGKTHFLFMKVIGGATDGKRKLKKKKKVIWEKKWMLT